MLPDVLRHRVGDRSERRNSGPIPRLFQRLALANIADDVKVDNDVIALVCALAQQCFLNEYVFAQSDEEAREASRLREVLLQKLSAGSEITPALLAAVAAYFPLHA